MLVGLIVLAAVSFWVGFIFFFRALERRRLAVVVMVVAWLLTMGSVVTLALMEG